MEFVLEHAALLERILLHLHSSMEQAYLQKDLFVSMMMRAVANVQQVSLGGTSQQKEEFYFFYVPPLNSKPRVKP